MFESLLCRKKQDISVNDKQHSILLNKIDKMNLTEMRSYIKNNISGLESSSDGLILVMNKLITKNAKTSKRYIEPDDMDSKLKKAFELVLAIAMHKRISVHTVELLQQFLEIYMDMILKYDKENKEIYLSRLKKAIKQSIVNIHNITELDRKMKVLGS
jgi:hypothetical protein